MKLLNVVVFLFPIVVHAACPGQFEGEQGELIFTITTAEDCGDSWGTLRVIRHIRKGDHEFDNVFAGEFDISNECDIPVNGFINTSDIDKFSFSCKSDGKSPLAGTTYRLAKSKRIDWCTPITYTCTLGCSGKRVPRTFVFDPQCESDE